MHKFKQFLTEISHYDSHLVESVSSAYSLLFESVSKVIAYHGTNFKIDKFDEPTNSPRNAVGNLAGIYFSTNKSDAGEYGKYIYTVELNLNKTFEGNPRTYLENKLNLTDISFGTSKERLDEYTKLINKNTIKSMLIENGYDSVHIPPKQQYIDVDEYIVFNPESIKILSVENNPNYYSE
jgi:hypothetical protein